jgi:mycofactocin precursor
MQNLFSAGHLTVELFRTPHSPPRRLCRDADGLGWIRCDLMEQDAVVAELDVVVDEVVEEELLVEEISIDGMCGVY